MNLKKYLFPSLLICTMLALILRVSAKPASAKPFSTSSSYDEIDSYIEQQRQRLNLPGVSLAIVGGEQIAHLRGFGQAHPGGKLWLISMTAPAQQSAKHGPYPQFS